MAFLLLGCLVGSALAVPASRIDAAPTTTLADVSSPSAVGWLFNSTYDPHALFVYDSEQMWRDTNFAGVQSKQIWTERQIGDWLLEYSYRHDLYKSDNYLYDLLRSEAFHSPGMKCAINDITCTIDGGLFRSGLSNDEFNALMVRASIANYQQWYHLMYDALSDTRVEMLADVPEIVRTLLPEYTPSVSDFSKFTDIMKDVISMVTVFCPVEGIVKKLFDNDVFRTIQAADAVELSTQQMVEAASKDILGKVQRKEFRRKAWEFVKEWSGAFDPKPDSNAGATDGDVAQYLQGAQSTIKGLQGQLGDTLDGVFRNGFADGGLISQFMNGDWVQSYEPSTGTWRANTLSKATDLMTQTIGKVTVSTILRDQPVSLFRRIVNFANEADCLGSFDDKPYKYIARPVGKWCSLNDDNTYSAWIPITWSMYTKTYADTIRKYTKNCQRMNEFTGTNGLGAPRDYGSFTYDPKVFLSEAMSCSATHQTLRSAADLTAGLYPSAHLNSISPANDAFSQVPCLYNAPVCDTQDAGFRAACKNYRQRVSDTMPSQGSGYRGPKWDNDECDEHELLWYCAQGSAIGLGQTSIEEVAWYYVWPFSAPLSFHWNGLLDQGADCFEEQSM